MWQTIATPVLVVVFLALIIGFFTYQGRVQFETEIEGQEIKVEWSTLNFREDPDFKDNIICELNRGDMVKLTGNHKWYGAGDPDVETQWYECTVTIANGSQVTGWVSSSGLDWDK